MTARVPDPRHGAATTCSLGIDLGTSSAKAVLVDSDGHMLAQHSEPYAVRSHQPGWAESEPEAWWAAVVGSVRRVVESTGRQPAAVGLSGQMHGLVLTDEAGQAIRPALLWADARATSSLAAYRRLEPAALARLANPLTPGMTGPLLMWVAEYEPRHYREASWALTAKDWLRGRLTGHINAEPSDASATLLYDVAGDRWDTDAVMDLGLDPSLLAPLVASAAPVGGLSRSAAEQLGVTADIPVATGAADTAAAIVGSGLAVGEVQLTIGTGAQIVRPVSDPVGGAATGTHLYRTAGARGWYAMAATVNAGLTLNWVREVLGATWDELYASVDRPIGARDPLFLPHLAGERTPYLDPSLRGAWLELSLSTDRPALLRAALEGVAFSIRQALDALPGHDRPARLRLAGGGTVSPAWRQMLADVLELPLYAVDVPAASARGAALLGAVAAGLVGVDDLSGRLAPTSALVAEPRPDRAGGYRRRRDRSQGRSRRCVTRSAVTTPRLGPRPRFGPRPPFWPRRRS